MAHHLHKRLRYFDRLNEKLEAGRFKFDANKDSFGFKRLKVLIEPDPCSTKPYPCVVYDKSSNIEFCVKIIPLTRKLRVKGRSHPGDVEVELLREFNSLLKFGLSPHTTYYIAHYTVPNNAKALRPFPLKMKRHYIEPKSRILVAEYVSGGSLESWINDEKGTLEQWRYVIFSVCWTLLVIQDRYRCVHNDLHYGNVLLDTNFSENEKPLAYHLLGENGLDLQFKVVVPGIMPKLWDWEVSNTFQAPFNHKNSMVSGMSHFPVEFDPHYDLHYFLTTLLEQDIPDELVDLIHSLYGDNFIPSEESKRGLEKKFGFGSFTSDASISSSIRSSNPDDPDDPDVCEIDEGASFDSDVWEIASSHGGSSDGQYDDDSDSGSCYESGDELDEKTDDESNSRDDDDLEIVVGDVKGEIKTEYLMGERMLNGAWRKVKDLVTPLTLLQHEFFACYRDDNRLKNKAPALTFRHIREPHTAWRLEGDRYV